MIALTPLGTSNTQDFIPSITEMAITPPSQNSNAQDDIFYAPEVSAGELASEFAMLDPSLSAFYGDLRNAATELAMIRDSGGDVTAALARFESAESLYQTRLFEVRSNKLVMDAASEKEITDEKTAMRAQELQDKMNEQLAALGKRRMKQKKKRQKEKEQQYSWFFYFAIGLWLAQMQQQRRNEFRQSMQSQMSARFAERA